MLVADVLPAKVSLRPRNTVAGLSGQATLLGTWRPGVRPRRILHCMPARKDDNLGRVAMMAGHARWRRRSRKSRQRDQSRPARRAGSPAAGLAVGSRRSQSERRSWQRAVPWQSNSFQDEPDRHRQNDGFAVRVGRGPGWERLRPLQQGQRFLVEVGHAR